MWGKTEKNGGGKRKDKMSKDRNSMTLPYLHRPHDSGLIQWARGDVGLVLSATPSPQRPGPNRTPGRVSPNLALACEAQGGFYCLAGTAVASSPTFIGHVSGRNVPIILFSNMGNLGNMFGYILQRRSSKMMELAISFPRYLYRFDLFQ